MFNFILSFNKVIIVVLSVPSKRVNNLTVICFSGKLLKCSACQCVYYCNRACQRDSWRIHNVECGNLKRVAPKVVPDVARLMARIIIQLNQGGGEEVGYYSKTGFRKFKDLMSRKYCTIITKSQIFALFCVFLFY